MKKIFFIGILLLNISFYAQPPGGGNGGRKPKQNQKRQVEREVKEFIASDVAGIFYYNIEEVIEKIKVKDDVLKASVSKALKDYNFKIREISFSNSVKFNELDVLMKSLRDSQKKQPNNDEETNQKDDLRQKIDKVILPIKGEIRDNEVLLNDILEGELSKKQLKKWLKYQKKKKESLRPKRPQNNQGQDSRNNRGGKRRQ